MTYVCGRSHLCFPLSFLACFSSHPILQLLFSGIGCESALVPLLRPRASRQHAVTLGLNSKFHTCWGRNWLFVRFMFLLLGSTRPLNSCGSGNLEISIFIFFSISFSKLRNYIKHKEKDLEHIWKWTIIKEPGRLCGMQLRECSEEKYHFECWLEKGIKLKSQWFNLPCTWSTLVWSSASDVVPWALLGVSTEPGVSRQHHFVWSKSLLPTHIPNKKPTHTRIKSNEIEY